MKSVVVIAMLGGMLAACGGGSGGNAQTPAPMPTRPDPMEAKIRAQTEPQLRTTFFHAIYDADFKCKKIAKITDKPRYEDHAVWEIDCGDDGVFTVVLQPGGTFNVTGAPPPAQTRPHFPKATSTPAALKKLIDEANKGDAGKK